MGSVDDRVVQMQFDNKAFEERIASTMQSLDKLKGSLDFANSKRGLDDLSTAGRNFNLEGIANAIDGIGSHFTAMGAIAFGVLQNIVNRAFSAGESLVKSMSFDQIKGGFDEFETNMNSIQTVLANTKSQGTTLDDVNKALDQLNTYSDQTIYNFGQMAKNIGTFTAAGINLDTSVSAIKGIANLAAVSGSNADQASTAMYQLSQALASGSVKLMDWNSVVNAGMGGKVFQEALFTTGKQLGTIKNVKVGESFKQWTDAGNSFRDSLQSGWITSQVLTDTLQGFTGDLTADQIKAMGYTDEQTQQILDMGITAKNAATKVKTLTQLVGTVKEAVGSGWTRTFQIIFGNFQEAQDIFTAFNNALGAIVSKSADARNGILQGWKDLGGRNDLIEIVVNTFQFLAKIVNTVKDAFHDVFPPMTSQRLFDLTEKLRDFTKKLNDNQPLIDGLHAAFKFIFDLMAIGITTVEGVGSAFGGLFDKFNNGGAKDTLLSWFENLATNIGLLKDKLVDGGQIKEFFKALPETIAGFFDGLTFDNVFARIVTAFGNVKDAIEGLFDSSVSTDKPSIMDGVFKRLGDRFGFVSTILGGLKSAFENLTEHFGQIKQKLDDFGGWLADEFGKLPQKIADILADTDYNKALDTVNTGLFGGLLLLIKSFFGDFKLDTGLFKNISSTFGELTNTLKAMQDKIKADALKQIAEALAILTGSILVISLIDSVTLTKSLSAITIGLGQLITTMALLNQISSGVRSSFSLELLAIGLVAVSASVILLALAVRAMAGLDMHELEKGLGGVAVAMGLMSAVAVPLSKNSSGMVRAGLGMIAVATAMNIMAPAVKSFAEMNWPDMAKGLTGVAGGLTALTVSMNFMPNGLITKGLGLIAVATALQIMALAVKSFAEMNWADMSRGLAGTAATLLVLAGAMNLMPPDMILQGAGLLAVGFGVQKIAGSVKSMAKMGWVEMARGLTALAGSLAILAVASIAMQEGLVGAIAIGVIAISLSALAEALVKFADIGWIQLLHGLGVLAALLVTLGLSAFILTPVIPSLLALGAALILVGAGFALIGVGAFLFATAFSIIATAGTQGAKVLEEVLNTLIMELPGMIGAFADGIISLATKIVEAIPKIILALDNVLKAILQLIIDNAPMIAKAFIALLESALLTIDTMFPQFVASGFKLLMQFLKGVEDNISDITDTVARITVKFLSELEKHMPELVTKGTDVLVAFLNGIGNNIGRVTDAAISVVTQFIDHMSESVGDLLVAGTDFIVNFIEGIGAAATRIANAATDTVVSFIGGLDDNILKIVQAGWDFVINLINGISDSIDENAPKLQKAGERLAGAIIDGMSFGLASKAKGLLDDVLSLGDDVSATMAKSLKVNSPSKVMIPIGAAVGEGLAMGIRSDTSAVYSAQTLGDQIAETIRSTMSAIPDALANMNEFNPTITPVLDLTNVQSGARQLAGLFANGDSLSFNQASAISTTSQDVTEDPQLDFSTLAPREIKFEQNNYSPKALSTAELYRQTNNQIAMAKEELAIL